MIKVALAFFGQPRLVHENFTSIVGFVDKAGIFETYNSDIISKYDTDVFCHMWWHKDIEDYDVSTWSLMNNANVPKNAPEIIKNRYKPVAMKVESPRFFSFPDKVLDFLNKHWSQSHNDIDINGKTTEHWIPKNYSNVISQLYSIQSVAHMVNEYSKGHKKEYDFVIMARYDTVVTGFPDLNTCERDKFYLPNNHPAFSDSIQFFGIELFDWALNVFNDIELENVYTKIWEPSPESFKKNAFLNRFKESNLAPIPIYGHVVRGIETAQWIKEHK